MTVEKDMDELVRAIVEHASKKNVPFSEKIDALKALTAYRLANMRLNRRHSDDEPADEPSFATFRSEVNGHGDKQPTRVRGGRERT